MVRSVRLNQASITSAINFLVTLGAESAVSRDRLVTNATAVPVGQLAGGSGGSAITQTQTATESRIENQRVNYADSTPLLRGLQISGDERTNQVTLVGEPKKVGHRDRSAWRSLIFVAVRLPSMCELWMSI